ncbi:Nucleoside-diphosphate-sugar epimerase [Actinopolymorpha cephalotaxi]|uniref:Nucleoside-diphosphate-sugar epimerase n=1 Tax=Actinopolymorpha cephalotaxi TaxID=504797 RepID=A0A1I2T8I2_9ACTN|nr:SDR family oxidoreductase [Actinopolymorpha cephalotaxi]NYH82975.1 nucleoside-diphosphate-sugar epimerase [Actinopolymorpha cephalotaxi]SFG61293.1 Nucleoside-diphosphate-sugar epimerase [Actinopolymorpha cephalotaxi]
MPSVLITGGAGYIGAVLAEMLLEEGHRVVVLDRLFFGPEPLASLQQQGNIEVVKGDVRSPEPRMFDGIDAVVHLAAISNDPACDLDPQISQTVNVDGTLQTAKLAKGAGVPRFIFASSCSIYGDGHGEILDEDSPKRPTSLYARTKVEAESRLAELEDSDFSVTALRNATAYGLSPRMRFDLVINIMTLHAYTRRRIYVLGQGKQWRPLVHVRDIARAFMSVMSAPRDLVAGQAFNVGSSTQNFEVIRIAQMIRDVVPHTEVEVVPDDPDKRNYHVNFDKIERVLGWKPEKSPYEGIVEIKQALERGKVDGTIQTRTVDYYRYLLEAEAVLREVSYEGAVF